MKIPTLTAIPKKRDELREAVLHQLKQPNKTVKVTVRDQLREFKIELMLFKESQISYALIRQILLDKVGLIVSEQTLREYCQQELGFIKRSDIRIRLGTEKPTGQASKEVEQTKVAINKAVNSTSNNQKRRLKTSITRSPENALSTQAASNISTQIMQQTSSLSNALEDY